MRVDFGIMEVYMSEEKYIQYHPLFASAIKLELREYSDMLTIIEEYQLSQKPLEIDILIIKKLKDSKILVNIAELFEEHNIIEYKGVSDYLSVDDYYKVKSYAYIYKTQVEHVDGIKLSSMSITMVSSNFPREMVKHLKEIRKLDVINKSDGIYYILGDDIKAQIIVTEKLPPKVNRYVGIITKKLREVSTAIDIIKEADESPKNKELEALVDYLLGNHTDEIMEEFDMGAVNLTKDQLEKAEKIMEKIGFKNKIKIEVVKNMLDLGIDIHLISKATDLSIDEVEELKNKQHYPDAASIKNEP